LIAGLIAHHHGCQQQKYFLDAFAGNQTRDICLEGRYFTTKLQTPEMLFACFVSFSLAT
jgi:hypothetical protein